MEKETLKKIAIRLDSFRKITQKLFFLFFLVFDGAWIFAQRIFTGPFDLLESDIVVIFIIETIFLFLQGFLPWTIFKIIKVKAPEE